MFCSSCRKSGLEKLEGALLTAKLHKVIVAGESDKNTSGQFKQKWGGFECLLKREQVVLNIEPKFRELLCDPEMTADKSERRQQRSHNDTKGTRDSIGQGRPYTQRNPNREEEKKEVFKR